jgi:hypothetical protein
MIARPLLPIEIKSHMTQCFRCKCLLLHKMTHPGLLIPITKMFQPTFILQETSQKGAEMHISAPTLTNGHAQNYKFNSHAVHRNSAAMFWVNLPITLIFTYNPLDWFLYHHPQLLRSY